MVQALEQLRLLESLANQCVRFTSFLFPSEDSESMNNLTDLFYLAGHRVDYVVVLKPAKVRTDLFKKLGLDAELEKFEARDLRLPGLRPATPCAWRYCALIGHSPNTP